jgi:hypothetical protein
MHTIWSIVWNDARGSMTVPARAGCGRPARGAAGGCCAVRPGGNVPLDDAYESQPASPPDQ